MVGAVIGCGEEGVLPVPFAPLPARVALSNVFIGHPAVVTGGVLVARGGNLVAEVELLIGVAAQGRMGSDIRVVSEAVDEEVVIVVTYVHVVPGERDRPDDRVS